MAKTLRINSLLDYVKYIQKECQEEHILFRGQRRQDRVLLPRIARLKLHTDILSAEKAMLADFKREAMPYLRIIPQNDWEWLAVAQHHGMATRLLDWTWNPLAALWFAVQKPPAARVNGVVWVFTVRDDEHIKEEFMEDQHNSPLHQRLTRIYEPKSVVARITAQRACFAVHGYDRRSRRFIPLETHQRYKKRLTKLIINRRTFHKIRFHLDRCGIHHASLFPDIGGLCQHVEWLHSLLSDEPPDN